VFNVISRTTSITQAFQKIDDILRQAVQGIADLIARPGLINVDFADIKTIMAQSGPAILGIGIAAGNSRARDAAVAAIQSPLLDISIDGARGVLFNVSGRESMSLAEVNEVAKLITESVDPEARIIFGATFDHRLRANELKVTVIASGFGPQAESLFRRMEAMTPVATMARKVSVTAEAAESPSRKETKETPIALNATQSALRELLEKKGGIDKEFETPALFRRKKQ
jgi:cell division protein FtsZ